MVLWIRFLQDKCKHDHYDHVHQRDLVFPLIYGPHALLVPHFAVRPSKSCANLLARETREASAGLQDRHQTFYLSPKGLFVRLLHLDFA